MNRPLLVICLLVFVGSLLFAADSPTGLVDDAQWRIGMAAIYDDAADENITTATQGFIRLLLDDLKDVEIHELGAHELLSLFRRYQEDGERKALMALGQLHQQRDELLFELAPRNGAYEEKTKAIQKAAMVLLNWQNLTLNQMAFPEKLPIEMVPVKDLSPTSAFDDERKNQTLVGLLTIHMHQIDQYFQIEIQLWQEGTKKEIWSGTTLPDDLPLAVEEASLSLRGLLLGRQWSGLRIQSPVDEALIAVDGKAVGVGYWESKQQIPGTLRLEVTAQGYLPWTEDVDLAPEQIQTITPELVPTNISTVLVNTVPPGATLRLGSVWLGETPLMVPLPERPVPLALELEGYRLRTLPLLPETERLTISLELAEPDPMAAWEQSRRKLHNSIAWFAASLAPTMALFGISQNYAAMNRNSTTTEAFQYSYRAYNITYGAMWGSIAINAGLLTNVFFKLHRYLKAAEELAD
ncbi:MAG: PEGA domain-containing protein [Spirochaetales bacterium]|nr:PEGA domain-containing protein [Spirochaetales bacterium]